MGQMKTFSLVYLAGFAAFWIGLGSGKSVFSPAQVVVGHFVVFNLSESVVKLKTRMHYTSNALNLDEFEK